MSMDNMNIQWYPGHMTKTRRQIEADLKQVDAVCEIVDARIPFASRNPDIDTICGDKPRIVVLNRMESELFPTTMYGVIYQKNQFSVVSDGAIERKTPSDLSITAAKLCLEGVKVTDALFFNVKGLRCWAAYNRPYLETIGDHEFYL